ncbi:hypothetical protein B0T20DRAFT_34044 [Sordaria brevicollis]|uniref:Uncharacterized protein n=1 Tax=Sordaria brevicollis TaxID=83679 RepID=A0AAE0P8S7_SORBR|nr:hypothetical protein B0T20DRAFT_34044 [Sordaria brevicollis]
MKIIADHGHPRRILLRKNDEILPPFTSFDVSIDTSYDSIPSYHGTLSISASHPMTPNNAHAPGASEHPAAEPLPHNRTSPATSVLDVELPLCIGKPPSFLNKLAQGSTLVLITKFHSVQLYFAAVLYRTLLARRARERGTYPHEVAPPMLDDVVPRDLLREKSFNVVYHNVQGLPLDQRHLFDMRRKNSLRVDIFETRHKTSVAVTYPRQLKWFQTQYLF